MATDFDRALGFVLTWEGGYSDHPQDPGGATYKGVTQRTYNGYRAKYGLEPRPVQSMSDSELRAIYWTYWQDSGALGASKAGRPGLALLMFDHGVNAGPSRAKSMYTGPEQRLGEYTNKRVTYYTSLAGWGTFGRGWARRLASANLLACELEENPPHRVYLDGQDITGHRVEGPGAIVNATNPAKTYVQSKTK